VEGSNAPELQDGALRDMLEDHHRGHLVASCYTRNDLYAPQAIGLGATTIVTSRLKTPEPIEPWHLT
jgi:hypothetical protein